MTGDYTLREKQLPTAYMIEVLRAGSSECFEVCATGGDRESAMTNLKSKLYHDISEGARAQKILESVLELEKESGEAGAK